VPRSRPRILLLQHIEDGPPDAYELELAAREVDVVKVRADRGEPVPDWRDFSGIVAMGGPMGAVEDDAHPWLPAERRAIAEATAADVPFWGVCLGAQLLAASLGADVWRGPEPEFGVRAVRVTDAAAGDPVFGVAPPQVHTLQWHKDTFALPEGARLLATSEPYPHQAFAWRNAYGVQFHLEPSHDVVEHWASQRPGSPVPPVPLAPEKLQALLEDLAPHVHGAMDLARRLMRRWLDLVEHRHAGLRFPATG
jgi:GMP synthase (glutamine-hydrolysing)